MPMLREERIASLFAPLIKASSRRDLSERLTTADLGARRDEQTVRLRSERVMGGLVDLASDSFALRLANVAGIFLAIDVDDLDSSARESLVAWAIGQGLTEAIVEPADFLFVVSELGGRYRPRSIYLSPENAEDVLDVMDDGPYTGHEIDDIQSWYRELAFFQIPLDHVLNGCASEGVGARVASAVPALRSRVLNADVARKIGDLAEVSNVNPENLYFALQSSHWRYATLEIYKCLEAAFYLPWVRRLKDALGSELSGLEIARQCKTSLRWREKEKESIVELFGMLLEPNVSSPPLLATNAFSHLQHERGSVPAIAERVYKLRNQLVHQYDYDSPEPIVVEEAEWPIITSYLCDLVYEVYTSYADDLNYEFPAAA